MRPVSDSAKASFLRDLADLLDRHPWAELTYTRDDDGLYLKEDGVSGYTRLGFGSEMVENCRAEANSLTTKRG